MAMFHFRLKSDKKPNETKISAVKHVEYINREGAFSDDEHEKENDKLSVILSRRKKYQMPLMDKTAVLQDLPISFDDLLMQREFMRNKFVDYPERKKLAVETAHKILERMEKKQTVAESHVEYINRERAYEKRGECIFHAHRLPKWTHDDPKKFFQAADKYEGVGNRRYMEIEFALPNELKEGGTISPYYRRFHRKTFEQSLLRLRDSRQNRSDVRRTTSFPRPHYVFRANDRRSGTKEGKSCLQFFQVSYSQECRKHGAPKNRNWLLALTVIILKWKRIGY